MSAKSENIKVVVRCRPMSSKEKEKGFFEVVKMNPATNQVSLVKKPDDTSPKQFLFNSVFPNNTEQQFIYDDAARPIIDSVLEGYNGTIFAYGQTGTGKTYTMEGEITSEKDKGIILHAFDHIFAHISKEQNKTFLVRASFLQIYMEDVCDLLGDPTKKLHVRQLDKNVTVVGLSSHIVKTPEEIMQLLVKGKQNRATGATAMNAVSSRSHSVFSIIVEQQEPDGRTRMGKLNLVDLAGSERLGKTEATGKRAIEGVKINQSLLVLGNVISALVTGSKHVPYRDSKLTQLLQDSLGGNAKTVMVATLGPANYNYDETLSTLLYATRARDIKNIPKINEDPKDALLGQLKAQIDALKKQLEAQNGATAGGIIVGDNEFLKQLAAQHEKQVAALMKEKNVNEEQRQKMRDALDEEYEKQKRTKEESEKLKARIEQMEKSVLVGGVNLVDKAKQQEEEMRAERSRMRRAQEEKKKLAEQGKQEQEAILLAEKKCGTLKEELTTKVHKIKQIRQLIKKMEEHIDDMQQQFEREKEEQVKQIRDLNRELSLLQLIAENFIPADQIELIESHCTYDEVNQRCVIDNMDLAGCHRKVEEEVPEEAVFIEGIEGAIFVTSGKSEVDVKKKAEATRRKKVAVDRMLNVFALSEQT